MAGVNRNDLMGGNSVTPFHSVWDRRPDKGNGGFSRIGLTQNSLHNLSIQVLLGKFKKQLMLNREVTIDSLIQSPDIQNTEISFKRMAAAGRRNRSQHMTGIHVLPYALGSPQKEREF